MKRIVLVSLSLLAAGCATVPKADAGPELLRLGQTGTVDGPKVTPLAVLEDSRCPINARCVWAGQVRLRIRVTLGAGSREHEIVTGKPLQIADGQLELVEVEPGRMAGQGSDKPLAYRFGFRFAGGL
jgi:hypothetical protein